MIYLNDKKIDEIKVADGTVSAKLQEKTFDATQNNITTDIFPDEGFDGISKLTANIYLPETRLEENKNFYLNTHSMVDGKAEITPTSGYSYGGMKKVTVIPEIEDDKMVTIQQNGETIITPVSDTYLGMSTVTVDVRVPEPDLGTLVITENGTYVPDPDSGVKGYYEVIAQLPEPKVEQEQTVYIRKNGMVEITPSYGYVGVKKVVIHSNVPINPEAMVIGVDDAFKAKENYELNVDILERIEAGESIQEIFNPMNNFPSSSFYCSPDLHCLAKEQNLSNMFRGISDWLEIVRPIDCKNVGIMKNMFPPKPINRIRSLTLLNLGSNPELDLIELGTCRNWWKDLNSFQKTIDGLYNRATARFSLCDIYLPEEMRRYADNLYNNMDRYLSDKGYILHYGEYTER